MAKKLLIFSLAYYPKYIGGAEVAIKEITDRIEDIEFHLITLRSPGTSKEEKIGNVHVHRVGLGFSYLSKIFLVPLAALKAISLNKKHRFDGFWAMMSYMVLPIVLARVLGTKVPYVLTLQEGEPYDFVFKRAHIRPFMPLVKKGFKGASVIQVISTFLGEWPSRLGYKGDVVVIPNGFSPSKFIEGEYGDEIEELKNKLGKKEDEVYLITVGRLVHKNANDDVIRAIPMMPENVQVLIVGGGEDEEMLRDLANELGVEDRVRFTGQVDREWTAKYRKVSDIFTRPSRSEGMGNSFISTMVARLPIIATQEGGIKDFLFDAKRNPEKETTGWAVDKDSPQQIAEAVKNIISNPEQVKKVTETAYNLALTNYNWDNIAIDMREKFLNRVL